MPLSPLTRVLAALITALIAASILFPLGEARLWRALTLYGLPLLLAILTWRLVKDAAPYDGRAFHRCLPPGDGVAFWKIMRVPLAMLGGIWLALLIYCLKYHFGWRPFSYGAVVSAVALAGCLAPFGIAASLGSMLESRVIWLWGLILGLPVLSWKYLESFGDPYDFGPEPGYHLSGLRIVILVCAILGFLIWWLAAVGRKPRLALVLTLITGALLPWIHAKENWLEIPAVKRSWKWQSASAPTDWMPDIHGTRPFRQPETARRLNGMLAKVAPGASFKSWGTLVGEPAQLWPFGDVNPQPETFKRVEEGYAAPAVFELAKGGGTAPLPGGGMAKVSVHEKDGAFIVWLELFRPTMEDADGPWFDQSQPRFRRDDPPEVLLLDESGKEAAVPLAVDFFNGDVLLGNRETARLHLVWPGQTSRQQLIEKLLRSKLYLFYPKAWPAETGRE